MGLRPSNDLQSGRIPYSTRSAVPTRRRVCTRRSPSRVSRPTMRSERLQGWTDAQVTNRQSLIAQAATYAGYSLVLLGESMCSAAIDLGPEMSRPQLFVAAQDRFTTAITAAQAASNTAMLNAARIGRARALLDQGKSARKRAPTPRSSRIQPSCSTRAIPRRTAAARISSGRRCTAVSSRRWTRAIEASPIAGVADPRVTVVERERVKARMPRRPSGGRRSIRSSALRFRSLGMPRRS